MAYDWLDQTRKDELHFYMVSPTNPNDVYGELDGVDLSKSSLTAEYYTDTRTSGSISVVGDNWIRGSLIRVTHTVPAWGYKRNIGTYIVTEDSASRANGIWTYDLTLHSRLFGLSTDKHPKPWTIAKNARALKAMEDSLKQATCPYRKVNSPKDRVYKTATVVESGTERLSALFELSNASGNRLDVDGDGYVTISPYVNPSSRTPSYRIDIEGERGISMDEVSRTTDWLQMADVSVVSHKYTQTNGDKSVEKEISGIAYVSSSLHQAHRQRGYTVTRFESVSEMSPQTKARADAIALQNLKSEQRELIEWTLPTTYLPVWEGDVIELVVHDGLSAYRGKRKCLVKGVDLELEHMTMSLTLKETSSGDKGDEE